MAEPLSPIAFSAHPHDRVAGRRTDDAWLEEVWSDPATRVLVLAGTRIRLLEGAVEWVSPDQAPAGVRILLGDVEGVVHLAVMADPAMAGEGWTPLRGAVPGLSGPRSGQDAAFVVHAIGIAEWIWATRHCARCGGSLQSRSLGHLLVCDDCGREEFPRTDPAVIMLIVAGDAEEERCLLGRHPGWPSGRYSTLAGFVEPGETLEQAVRREVLEETGVRVGTVDYFGSQPWPLPRSLMVGFLGRAESVEVTVDGEEIEDARWFTRAELAAAAASGELILPGSVSISRSLIEHWYGADLPGQW